MKKSLARGKNRSFRSSVFVYSTFLRVLLHSWLSWFCLMLRYFYTCLQLSNIFSFESRKLRWNVFFLSSLAHLDGCIAADFNVHKIQFWFFFSPIILGKPFFAFILRCSLSHCSAYHFKFRLCTLTQKKLSKNQRNAHTCARTSTYFIFAGIIRITDF